MQHVQRDYVDVETEIVQSLTDLCGAGAPINQSLARSVILAIIEERAPDLLHHPTDGGKAFKCSRSFVRRFLHNRPDWSYRYVVTKHMSEPVHYFV